MIPTDEEIQKAQSRARALTHMAETHDAPIGYGDTKHVVVLDAAYRAAIAERDNLAEHDASMERHRNDAEAECYRLRDERNRWRRQYGELAHAYIERPNEDMPTMFARHEAERKEDH